MQIECFRDVLKRYSDGFLSSKIDDQKMILSNLKFSEKIQMGDARISFNDALLFYCRLERGYQALRIFVNKSLFLRKEDFHLSYKLLYEGLNDLTKVLNATSLEAQLVVHMKMFCYCRTKLISFAYMESYMKLTNMILLTEVTCNEALIIVIASLVNSSVPKFSFNNTKNHLVMILNCSEFRNSLSDILTSVSKIHNELDDSFVNITELIKIEILILTELFNSQIAIADLIFLDSLLSLKRCKNYINKFSTLIGIKNFEVINKNYALLFWWNRFHSFLLSKFTLYWYDSLVRNSSNQKDMEQYVNSENPSLVTSIIQFHCNSNASFISLLFDTTCQSFPFLGHGYVLRGSEGEAPKGVESIPPIFTAPVGSTLPSVDRYAIVMQISGTLNQGDSEELNRMLYSYDEKLNRTYFIQKLECRVFLALVYENHKLRKDRQILDFISNLIESIRFYKLVTLLKSH